MEFPDDKTSKDWQQDPENWIWGIFYYNKQDSRIFPPKRIGEFGFTVNFANPKSVLALVIGLGFFVFITSIIVAK